ncbi:MAG: 50S ribosomal protein L13 [Candidatus Nanoarchaeia archaeon]|jgi:large subunit ribosomal protein L13|nr:50S ribosomal protein L13 [Candidatus Nanoarchaeia archaeon]|tara:strand:- start:8308 stop:8730 length:423 start_codon:yes stop_codon:yes gene_type:complete
MIINAENLILGRFSTIVAKKALMGEAIDVVNVEKAVIVGTKENILDKYKTRRERGETLHGPYFPRTPDRLVRRTIRGMLPYKQEKGRLAFKRIKCYVGIPEDLKDKKIETLDKAKLSPQKMKFLTIKQLTSYLGAKDYGN